MNNGASSVIPEQQTDVVQTATDGSKELVTAGDAAATEVNTQIKTAEAPKDSNSITKNVDTRTGVMTQQEELAKDKKKVEDFLDKESDDLNGYEDDQFEKDEASQKPPSQDQEPHQVENQNSDAVKMARSDSHQAATVEQQVYELPQDD